MTLGMTERPDIRTLAAVIARSQIAFVPVLPRPLPGSLPDHFDETDRAMLDWIAAEGRRRASRCLARI